MRVQDTELDYEEPDEVALKRYLGKGTEPMETWAQRVWKNCRLKSEEISLEDLDVLPDPIPEPLARVYKARPGQSWQERAKELWENKKLRRREALCREFHLRPSHDNVMKIKVHPKYKTRDQQDEEEANR